MCSGKCKCKGKRVVVEHLDNDWIETRKVKYRDELTAKYCNDEFGDRVGFYAWLETMVSSYERGLREGHLIATQS